MSNAPLLSTRRCKTFFSVCTIELSWYFVSGLLSIRSFVFVFNGTLNSSANFFDHVIVLVPESADIYSASVELCVTTTCLADVQIIGCPEAKTISPNTNRLVSISAA